MTAEEGSPLVDLTAAARALAAARRRVERRCAVCGASIVGTGKRRYCSEACKSAAYRQRLGAAYWERRRAQRQRRRQATENPPPPAGVYPDTVGDTGAPSDANTDG